MALGDGTGANTPGVAPFYYLQANGQYVPGNFADLDVNGTARTAPRDVYVNPNYDWGPAGDKFDFAGYPARVAGTYPGAQSAPPPAAVPPPQTIQPTTPPGAAPAPAPQTPGATGLTDTGLIQRAAAANPKTTGTAPAPTNPALGLLNNTYGGTASATDVNWTDPGGWGADDVDAEFSAAGILQGPRDITDPERVAWQLNQLLDENGQYMQSARDYALEGANARGLLNSSIAVGASQRAAIDAGLPIAQQDAQTYATSGLSAQEAGQQAALDAANAQNQFNAQRALNQQNISGNIALGEQESAAAMSQLLTRLNNERAMQAEALRNGDQRLAAELENRLQTTQMEIDARRQLDYMVDPATGQEVHTEVYLRQMGIDFDTSKLTVQTRAEFGSQVSSITSTYVEQLNNLLRDSSLKGTGVRESRVAALQTNVVNQLNSLAAIYQLDDRWEVSDLPGLGGTA